MRATVIDPAVRPSQPIEMPPVTPIEPEEPSFGLCWPGRQEALRACQDPAAGVLQDRPDEGHGPPAAPHRFIEGDNLEVLRLLRDEYADAVRCIYIDPPYNTGQRRVYRDRYASRRERTAAGRRHAAWLTMMYPRLVIARELLRDDGVIAISIDDHEMHHLRLLLDEIYGESNFISTVTWRRKVVRGRGAAHVLPQTEYVLLYARRLDALPPFAEPLTQRMVDEYRHADEQGPYKLIPLAKSGTAHSARPNLVYEIEAPDGTMIPCPTHQWRWSRETLERRRDEIEFRCDRHGQWRVYTRQRLVVDGRQRGRTPLSYYDRVTSSDGTAEIKALFGDVVIDFPKPVRLIRDVITWVTGGAPSDDLVLDFFAGACPTAQAVCELNVETGSALRFIMAQEAAATPARSVARRLGYDTVAAVGRERIRRVMHRLDPDGAHGLGFSAQRVSPA